MALIIDPDLLNDGTEVDIDSTSRTITLNEAGNLSSDGVTLQALYSFLKEEWISNSALIPFPFPMVAITPEQFEFVNGWKPADDPTRKLIRTGGWAEISQVGSVEREYLGVITLGFIGGSNTAYYAFNSDTSKTDFTFNGPVNEAIQTFGDASNGDFDKRNEVLTVYVRTQGQTFDQITTTNIGVSTLTYKVERFPLSENSDLKISTADGTITTTAPYTGMSITYFSTAQSRSIGGTPRNFGIIIDGNNGTAEQIYEYVQYQVRQNSDIDSGVGNVNGLLADSLLQFVGDSLQGLFVTNPIGGGGGVYIDNFNSNDTNRISFQDNTNTTRTFPFVAAGSINFNDNLVTDGGSVYKMFFTTNPAGDFGSSTAVTVEDNLGNPISGSVSGASVSFDFDYDGNVQGGRTPGADAEVTIVAIGLNRAQYVVTTGTITRATGINISLVSALERNYANQ
jgi:hypothetical protein